MGDPDGIFQDSWRSCTGSMGFQGIFGNSVGIGWELEGSIRIFRDLLGFLAILLYFYGIFRDFSGFLAILYGIYGISRDFWQFCWDF